MDPFTSLFPMSQSSVREPTVNLEVFVLSCSETESPYEVEVISTTKIHSCEVCEKIFSSKKKYSSHLLKTNHTLRASLSILNNLRLDRPYHD